MEKDKKNGININTGIVAHVDAGKTTLSEALLYMTGAIRTQGRVDHRDTFLDTYRLERERGITIFSKQASLDMNGTRVTLLDTPGHTDFTAETERVLSVLDCAILIISGADGIQAHTETLWDLLRHYSVPTLIWVNKMDIAHGTRDEIMRGITARFGTGCVDMADAGRDEAIAVCDENVLERYLADGVVCDDDIAKLVSGRRLFPCFFGSALKLTGVEALIEAFGRYVRPREYPEDFRARVFKITRDERSNRLTWMKITGGALRTRDVINGEKVTQLRVYSGERFTAPDEVRAGDICAVCGLNDTYAGQGLGGEKNSRAPIVEPVLTYSIELPAGVDPQTGFRKLKALSEEDPTLRIVWNEQLHEIQARLMGKVQVEILREMISDRFGMEVGIGAGRIMYRETIAAPVEGCGHFEPLRHYAEVHLLLEPLPPGAGLHFGTACAADTLDVNWQRLVLTHLAEKTHVGVLTGSPIDDMRITLVAGRAHLKHTEGGDFRQACYRALRQGLMKAENVLLEPFYDFTLIIPSECVGRAVSDVKAMSAVFDAPVAAGEYTEVSGRAPASEMQDYQTEVLSYTRGRGRLSCRFGGYFPCHDTARVIEEIGYDPERDIENTADSVFCSHGAGVNVKWDVADDFMHVDSGIRLNSDGSAESTAPKVRTRNLDLDERELEAIMEREFGPIKRPKYSTATYNTALSGGNAPDGVRIRKRYLIVDGYNIIFAWDELKALAKDDISAARARLTDILANYRGFRECELVLVFDAYKVSGHPSTREEYHGINVVYTQERESADAYIEKLVHEIGKNYQVCVVTSDNMIQVAALRLGVMRMSANELLYEVELAENEISDVLRSRRPERTTIGDVSEL